MWVECNAIEEFTIFVMLLLFIYCLLLINNVRVLCERLAHNTIRHGLSLRTDWNIRPEFQFKAILKTQRKRVTDMHTRVEMEKTQ